MMTRRANTAAFLKQAGLQLERANTDVQMVLFEYRPPKLETSVEAQRNHEKDLLRAAQEEGLDRRRKGVEHEGAIPWDSILLVRKVG